MMARGERMALRAYQARAALVVAKAASSMAATSRLDAMPTPPGRSG
jgi:hypothetical protein